MTINKSAARPDRGAGAMLKGGRWIAFAGFTYVVAWLIGLAIGMATSSPGPTDSASTIEATSVPIVRW